MEISIFVMTKVQVFGEYIQKALQNSGRYSVTLVRDSVELIGLVQIGEPQVAVLDMALEPDVVNLVNELKEIDPGLAIILFNDKMNIAGTHFEESTRLESFEGVLRISDLLTVLEAMVNKIVKEKDESSEPGSLRVSFPSRIIEERSSSASRQAPEWLSDVNDVAQMLTRLTLDSAAHAALITRNVELWAYAGHLSRPAAEELAQSVWHYWARDGGSDLAQFIRLEANHREYMLYATGLGGEYVLGLAFEAAIPFSEMRMQAGMLAKQLITPPREQPMVGEEEFVSRSPFDSDSRKTEENLGLENRDQQRKDDDILGRVVPNEWYYEEGVFDDRQAFFEDLLDEVEIPDPDGQELPSSFEWVEVEELPQDQPVKRGEDNGLLDVAINRHREQDSSLTSAPENLKDAIRFENQEPDAKEREAVEPGEVLPDWKHLFEHDLETSVADEPQHVHPKMKEEENLKGQLPVDFLGDIQQALRRNELAYGCLLVPRLPRHTLVGDLLSFLSRWIKLHSLAFGWRLEYLLIQPAFFHWVAVLSPDRAPGQMVVNLRKFSSEDLFAEYPRLERDNPSGDFWAPGCLILNGRQPLSQKIVRNFLEETRYRQGIIPRRPEDSDPLKY